MVCYSERGKFREDNSEITMTTNKIYEKNPIPSRTQTSRGFRENELH